MVGRASTGRERDERDWQWGDNATEDVPEGPRLGEANETMGPLAAAEARVAPTSKQKQEKRSPLFDPRVRRPKPRNWRRGAEKLESDTAT